MKKLKQNQNNEASVWKNEWAELGWAYLLGSIWWSRLNEKKKMKMDGPDLKTAILEFKLNLKNILEIIC